MAYKLIDDETALQIYEAVQQNTHRSFGHYNRLRQLPRTKISGEILFYLDVLLDFSSQALGRDEMETLQEVVDAGIVSWFANLDPALQKKAGFTLENKDETALSVSGAAKEPVRRKTDDTAESLSQNTNALEIALAGFREENERLSKEIEVLKEEKVLLRREMDHLEKINEEMMEKTLAEETSMVRGPAFLAAESAGSVYTEMTTHMLTPSPNEKSAPAKKKNRKKKRG